MVVLHAASGDITSAAAIMQDVELAGFADVMWVTDPVRAARVEVALAERNPAAVELAMQRVAALRGLGMRAFLADALERQAHAHWQQGDRDQARLCWQAARAEAEALGLRRSLWPTLSGLSGLASEAGRTDEAAMLREQARDVIGYIAAHCPTAELRHSFLARPDVARLF
jgi:hypothetical protein